MGGWAWFGGGETSLSRVWVCAFSKAACAAGSSAEAGRDVVGALFVGVPFFVVGGRVRCQALGGGALLEAGSMQLFCVLAAPSQRALRGICL